MAKAFSTGDERAFARRNQEYEEALGHRLAESGKTFGEVNEMLGPKAATRSKIMQGWHKYHEANKPDSY